MSESTDRGAAGSGGRGGAGTLGAAGAGLVRFSSVHFLGALILLFVMSAYIEGFESRRLIDAVVLSVVMLAGVFAVGGRARSLAWAIGLGAPAVVTRWVAEAVPGSIHPAVPFVFGLLFLVFVVGRLLAFVLRAPRVDLDVLCAGVAGYLTLAIIWAAAYVVAWRFDPGAFAGAGGVDMDGFNALYFSVITLTTVGYGDITPVSSGARMLAMMEAVTGTLYIAVFISRLVAVYSVTPRGGP